MRFKIKLKFFFCLQYSQIKLEGWINRNSFKFNKTKVKVNIFCITDKPYVLHPVVNPGTLTVSNSEDVDLRTIVKDLTIKVTVSTNAFF